MFYVRPSRQKLASERFVISHVFCCNDKDVVGVSRHAVRLHNFGCRSNRSLEFFDDLWAIRIERDLHDCRQTLADCIG